MKTFTILNMNKMDCIQTFPSKQIKFVTILCRQHHIIVNCNFVEGYILMLVCVLILILLLNETVKHCLQVIFFSRKDFAKCTTQYDYDYNHNNNYFYDHNIIIIINIITNIIIIMISLYPYFYVMKRHFN